ncbi:hypothetical protein PQX77_009628 [Marasmius sp. AFHP31]|nr:hypothetical protein PQX77_009628 [Marasmius sp. AFHP31]
MRGSCFLPNWTPALASRIGTRSKDKDDNASPSSSSSTRTNTGPKTNPRSTSLRQTSSSSLSQSPAPHTSKSRGSKASKPPPFLVTPQPSGLEPIHKDPGSPLSPAPPSPSPSVASSSSSSSSSSLSSQVMSTSSAPASSVASSVVSSQGPRHAPVISAHRLSYPDFKLALRCMDSHFKSKSITDDSEKKSTFSRCFQSHDSLNFFTANEDIHTPLSFDAFVKAIMPDIVGANWQKDLSVELRSSKMLSHDAGAFKNLWNKVKVINADLKDSVYHSTDAQVQERCHSNLVPPFRYLCEQKGFDEHSEFKAWLEGVTALAEKYPAWFLINGDRFAKQDADHFASIRGFSSTSSSAHNPASRNSSSAPPPVGRSRSTPGARAPNRYSMVVNPSSNRSDPATATAIANGLYQFRLPVMEPEERQIYRDHRACFKCRCFYADHVASNCKDETNLTVEYRTITPALAAIAAEAHRRTGAPITLDAVLKHALKKPAASTVAGPSAVRDLSSILESPPAPVSAPQPGHLWFVHGSC